MNKHRNLMTEKILDLTLEIIYLLTGEDHVVVKKPCDSVSHTSNPHVSATSFTTQNPDVICLPHSLIHERKNDKKILELTNKIIQLLTGEVPIRCEDIAVYFSMEEWEYLEGHKDLYRDMIMEDHQPHSLGDKSVTGEFHAPVYFNNFGTKDKTENITKNGRKYLKLNKPKTRKTSELKPTKYISTRTKKTSAMCEGHFTHTNIYLPTEHIETEYPPTSIKQEFALHEDVNLPNTDIHAITKDMQTENSPTHIKEEPAFCKALNLTDIPNYTRTEHTQTVDAFAFFDSYLEDNSHMPDISYFMPLPYDTFINQKSSKYTQNTQNFEALFHYSEHPKNFINSELVRHLSAPRVTKAASSDTGKLVFSHSEIRPPKIHKGKQFSCSECGKCFNQKPKLNRHQTIHRGEKPFKCEECGRCFNLKHHLIAHRKIHTGEKPFRCTECGKCFSRAAQLVSHKRIHTGEKPFVCTECGECFIRPAQLVSHKWIHTGEKPFKCDECGKCFNFKHNLMAHQKIHTGEKPFKCNECGKCFSRATHLASHKRIHTGEKPFKCNECGICFTWAAQLASHKIIHAEFKNIPF
ncbi:oocyte zinc finger -like [Pelobates cultripes]|uniref:Oocyte zinc finger -like n=2 Tax=Pelobates cultripes TaxID=61616 RepID=A0AAD1WN05_PELCU|nr:oocyte zinc finger -like [Pelobates cultripes]